MGGAHMGISESVDTMLTWTELFLPYVHGKSVLESEKGL